MSFPWTEPEVIESINRLTYRWQPLDLLIEADRITDAGQAELWFYHNNDTGNKLLHIARVNLLASPTMTQLAKRMVTQSEDIPWPQVLTYITKTAMEYQRRGEPGIILQPVSAEELKPVFYLEPMIIKGVPNIIFGEKGVNKTTLGLMALGLIEIGYQESPTGLAPALTVKTGILDWEGTKDLTLYTIARLIEGETIPYFEPAYLRCKHTLADEIDRVANFIHDNRIEVLLIDSLGQAAGSDKFDTSGKAAALRFFECLRQLNVTSLIIAQTSKSEEGRKTIYGSTYFTYYARNIFELRGKSDDADNDRLHLALLHQEGNYTRKYPPLGFQVHYTDTTISISREEVLLSQFLERASQTKALLEFLSDGTKTVGAISLALSLSDRRTRALLSRAKKRGLVINLGSGLWGLLSESGDYSD